MNRLMSPLAALAAASLAQGCATSQSTQHAPLSVRQDGVGFESACAGPRSQLGMSPLPRRQCAAEVLRVANRAEIAPDKNAPSIPGHPLTSVVVTQCNLIVAVYMTMPDGSLLRYDKSAAVPAQQLLEMAYAATRSERIEVSCNDTGAVGYEKHDPV